MAQFINKPLNPLVAKMKMDDRSIFLTGLSGTGKSTLLKYYYMQNNNHTVNMTFCHSSYMPFNDIRLYDVYYITLIVNKILLYIKKNDPNLFKDKFILIMNYNLNLLSRLKEISFEGLTKDYLIEDAYLDEPVLILEEFLNFAMQVIDFKKLTFIIDNFDTYASSSEIYQKLIYTTLFNNFKVIATISSKDALVNSKKIDNLSKSNQIIPLTYSRSTYVFKILFDKEIYAKYKIKSLSSYLSNDTCQKIINLVEGNIFTMKRIFIRFKRNLYNYSPYNYEKKLLEIANEVVANDKKEGISEQARKLYI